MITDFTNRISVNVDLSVGGSSSISFTQPSKVGYYLIGYIDKIETYRVSVDGIGSTTIYFTVRSPYNVTTTIVLFPVYMKNH